jgi:hypothetical protein
MKKVNLVRSLALVMSLISIQNFSFENTDKLTTLIPNIPSKFSPPSIVENPETDFVHSLYHIRIDCSEASKQYFSFEPRADFCDGFGLKGSAKELNETLDQFLLTAPPLSIDQLGTITYRLWEDRTPAKIITYVQSFRFETILSMKVLKDVIIYDATKSRTIEQDIAQLNERFIEFQDDFHFELAIDNERIPDWLSFKIVQYNLVIFGKPPKHFDENLNFNISIIDLKSGLRSREISLNLITVRDVSLDNFFIGFVIFFVVFCILIVGLVLACLTHSKSGEIHEKKKSHIEDLDDSVHRNVLSESITNWTSNRTYAKINTSDSISVGKVYERKGGLNDSINELELLKNNLGPVDRIVASIDRSFNNDNSLSNLIEFGEISTIQRDHELGLSEKSNKK